MSMARLAQMLVTLSLLLLCTGLQAEAGTVGTNITESIPAQSLKLMGISIKEESLFKMCRPCGVKCSVPNCCLQYHCNGPGQPLGSCVTKHIACGCDEYCKPYMVD
uniref:Uncharacterized protein n=1 Tax=Avena sativa TaxID=4498 RepID=A0ACD5XWD1_AVESA